MNTVTFAGPQFGIPQEQLQEAVNASCTCGGRADDNQAACPCRVWHYLRKPAPARIAEPIAQPEKYVPSAPPAEGTSNVIERAISLMDKDSPEEAYELLKKHSASSPAEKSQSDGAISVMDGYKIADELRDAVWQKPGFTFTGKTYQETLGEIRHMNELLHQYMTPVKPEEGWTGNKCPKCHGTGEHEDDVGRCTACGGTGDEWGNLPATPKPELKVPFADTLAADGIYETVYHKGAAVEPQWVTRVKHGPYVAYHYIREAADQLTDMLNKEQQTSARLKGAEAECASLVMQASRNAAEQAVAKERASCAAIVPKLTEIVDFLYSEGCTTSANQLHALNARLTQPSNLSGEAT